MFRLLSALVFVSTAIVTHAQETADRPPSVSAIDAAMQEFVDQGVVAGAVTLVAHGGKIVHLGAVGHADIESDMPMKPGTLFSIASMTKPVTATAVMILQDEGKLSVDDKVSQYIPAFKTMKLKDGTPAGREITIRDVITHTSGLTGDQIFRTTLSEAVDEISTRSLAFQPGSKWQYSPGLNVAGRIVEIVSQQPFEKSVKERILTPLRMNNTTFYPNSKQRRLIATIYGPGEGGNGLAPSGNRIVDPAKVTGPNPSGGLFSSAAQLYRFYQMVLNDGRLRNKRIVSKEAVEQMTQRQTGDLTTGFTTGNCWGLGWCIVREPQGVTAMLSPGTFGHGGAFGTQGWVDPKTETIYVLLIQRTKMGNSDGSDIRKVFQQTANEAIGI